MANEIKQTVVIEAQLSKIQGDLKTLENNFKSSFGRIEGLARNVSGTLSSAFGITLGIGGVTAAVTGLIALAKGAADYADAIGKAAQVTGTSTEALSAWRHGADLAGVSTEELETGLTRYSRQIADAAAGNKTAQSTFDSLGISIRNPAGEIKTTEALLGDLAERFQRMPDGALKTNAAMELLGRSGARLIPLLNGGRENIKAFTDEAERMGLIVSGDAARAAEQFNDNMLRLQKQVLGLKLAIGNTLIPVLVRLLDLFGQLGGVKLEGFEQRALERQITTLKELQRSATPGTRGFEFYASAIAEAESKLKALNESQKKVATTKTPPITISTNAAKAKNDVDNFLDGLEKKLADLEGKKIELKFGADSGLAASLDAQLEAFKEKLRDKQLPIPKGLDDFFKVLKDKILAANDELKTMQFELAKLDELGKAFSQDSAEWGTAVEEMAKRAADALESLEPKFRDLQKVLAIEILPPDQQGAARAVQEVEERIKAIEEWRQAAIRAGGDVEAVNREAAQASADAWVAAGGKMKEQVEEQTEFMRRAFERGFDAVSDAIEDLLNGEVTSFEDFGKKILRVMNSIIADAVTLDLKKIILGEDFGKKGAGVGGLLGDLLPDLFGKKKETGRVAGTTAEDVLDAERGQELIAAATATLETQSATAQATIQSLSATASTSLQAEATVAQTTIQTLGTTTTGAIEAVKAAAIAAIEAAAASSSSGGPPGMGGGGGGFGDFFGGLFGGGGSALDAGAASEGGGLLAMGYHKGGEVFRKFHEGGAIGLKPNESIAVLENDEFVLRKEAARALGKDRLDKLNRLAAWPRLHDGGALPALTRWPRMGRQSAGQMSGAVPAGKIGGAQRAGDHNEFHFHGVQDFDSFRRSKAQMLSDMNRAVQKSRRHV